MVQVLPCRISAARGMKPARSHEEEINWKLKARVEIMDLTRPDGSRTIWRYNSGVIVSTVGMHARIYIVEYPRIVRSACPKQASTYHLTVLEMTE